MGEMPAEIRGVLEAVARLHGEVDFLIFGLGQYTAPSSSAPGKRKHDGMRVCARDVVVAGRDVITATERLVNLAQRAEKAQGHAKG